MKQTELELQFLIDETGVSFLDIGQCYSLINRISCRQGMQWAIAGISVHSDLDTKFQIFRLPESWPVINAWEKSYHIWRKSQDQVLDDQPGIEGRYRDFKVFMNQAHQTAGVAANMIPEGYAITGFGVPFGYDWEPSDIQVPNDPVPGSTTGYNLHVLDSSTPNSKGMIEGYAFSRSRPQQIDPNVPDAPALSGVNWMEDAFDVGDNLEEIRDNILTENDEPPYVVGTPGTADEFYPGGGAQGLVAPTAGVLFTRAGLGTQTRTGGFTAPCGLLKVITSGDAADALLTVHIMPGDYKGAMARSMQDVN